MDGETLAVALSIMKKMPDNAVNSAAQAEEAAQRAQTAADSVTSATVPETKTYLGIEY